MIVPLSQMKILRHRSIRLRSKLALPTLELAFFQAPHSVVNTTTSRHVHSYRLSPVDHDVGDFVGDLSETRWILYIGAHSLF